MRFQGTLKKSKRIEGARQIGIATTIPFLLVAGPVIGYFVGNWIDKKLGTEPYLMIILILLGFLSSGKETYKLIKQLNDGSKDTDDEFHS
ncbi:MAG: AtpZ/AtpI family protein [candidate division Zixibacteria bacterium]